MKSIKEYLTFNESYEPIVWDDEANDEGKILVTTSELTHGGRESLEVNWELEKTDENDDSWFVKATVIDSENPRKFKKGWYIEFELSKDTSLWDLEDVLLRTVEEERGAAWSSGHDI